MENEQATNPRLAGGPERVAIVGAGVIGAAWAARWALVGAEVLVHDPHPNAAAVLERTVAMGQRAWERLGLNAAEPNAVLEPSLERVVADAQLVHESVPERLELKQTVYADIEQHVGAEVPVVSSTSGLLPSELAAHMAHPERFATAHPFNPVYLLPLVEVVPGQHTDPRVTELLTGWFAAAGMEPLVVRQEVPGFVADRLMEALWREALWLVADGVATTGDIDRAMTYGFGLRWAQMGLFETYLIAGGDGGMEAFLRQFGPALAWPWSKLTDVPNLDDELVAKLVRQCEDQAEGKTPAELAAVRDENLVDLLLALEANDQAGGKTLARFRSAS